MTTLIFSSRERIDTTISYNTRAWGHFIINMYIVKSIILLLEDSHEWHETRPSYVCRHNTLTVCNRQTMWILATCKTLGPPSSSETGLCLCIIQEYISMLALNCRYVQSKWIGSTLHPTTALHAFHGNPPHAKFKLGNMLAHDLWKHCLEFTMNVGCYVANVALGLLALHQTHC